LIASRLGDEPQVKRRARRSITYPEYGAKRRRTVSTASPTEPRLRARSMRASVSVSRSVRCNGPIRPLPLRRWRALAVVVVGHLTLRSTGHAGTRLDLRCTVRARAGYLQRQGVRFPMNGHAICVVAMCMFRRSGDILVVAAFDPGLAPFGRNGFATGFSAAHQQFQIHCSSELEALWPSAKSRTRGRAHSRWPRVQAGKQRSLPLVESRHTANRPTAAGSPPAAVSG